MRSVVPVKRPERILVRGPNWLGDVIMSTPGLRALRRAYPDARIVAQVPSPLVPLLEGTGDCDEIWPVASRRAGRGVLRREAMRVAASGFDLGIVIPESISSALRMRQGRVGRITGFARDPIRRWLLDDVVEAPSEWGRRRWVSRERFVMRLMSAVGADGESDLGLRLCVMPSEEKRLEQSLVRVGLGLAELQRSPPVILAPGASFGPSKCWPVRRYAELADRFARRGRIVMLVGGPGEGARLEAVRAAMRTRPVVFDDVLDLGALKALVRRAGLLVANDAGTRHLAAAFGVPGVIFFGPTSVAKTADNLEPIEILEADHACRPCYRRACPTDHRCLRSISVEHADQAAMRVLDRVGPWRSGAFRRDGAA